MSDLEDGHGGCAHIDDLGPDCRPEAHAIEPIRVMAGCRAIASAHCDACGTVTVVIAIGAPRGPA